MTDGEKSTAEARCEVRTNMFVMATVYAGTGSAPVKIRNLSPRGALIEGGVLPHAGTKTTLSRGGLTIAGEVVWAGDARAGLKFASLASVAHWLPNGRALAPQDQVDAIFQHIEASPEGSLTSAEPCPGRVTAVEMTAIKKLIESLAEDLANDVEMLVRHGSKLQALDLAAQVLGKLASERA